MPIITCIECGNKRKETNTRIKKGYGKYCSRKCYLVVWKRNPPINFVQKDWWTNEIREKISKANKGRKHPYRERPKMKGRWLGDKNPRFKHGESTTPKYHTKMNKISRERFLIKKAGRPISDKCEICECSVKETNRPICFDHDHKTGNFRGWICRQCNSALGMINDNATIAKKMVVYLESHSLP